MRETNSVVKNANEVTFAVEAELSENLLVDVSTSSIKRPLRGCVGLKLSTILLAVPAPPS